MKSNYTMPELDANGLRKFAFTLSLMVCLIFGLLIPYLFSYSLPKWPWILAAGLLLWGGILPNSFKLIYLLWMRFGLLMSKITTPIILGVLFFLVITPTSLMLRIIKKDPMQRELDANVDSYRVLRDESINTDFKRPF